MVYPSAHPPACHQPDSVDPDSHCLSSMASDRENTKAKLNLQPRFSPFCVCSRQLLCCLHSLASSSTVSIVTGLCIFEHEFLTAKHRRLQESISLFFFSLFAMTCCCDPRITFIIFFPLPKMPNDCNIFGLKSGDCMI